MTKKYTHMKCLKEVNEDGMVVFKEEETYKIVGFDYHSFLYYIEPKFYEDNPLPEEFVILSLDKRFEFLVL